MFGIGFTELVLIFVVALLVFGPEKIPGVATRAAKMYRELRTTGAEFATIVRRELVDVQAPLREARNGLSDSLARLVEDPATPAASGTPSFSGSRAPSAIPTSPNTTYPVQGLVGVRRGQPTPPAWLELRERRFGGDAIETSVTAEVDGGRGPAAG